MSIAHQAHTSIAPSVSPFVFHTSSRVYTMATSDTAAVTVAATSAKTQAVDNGAIRPFTVPVAGTATLDDLRRRITATRWPEKETVGDASQGVQLATTEKLARYWATDYDWRKCEEKLGAFPHFVTEIDGLDVHFIHVRSKHANARVPLILAHRDCTLNDEPITLQLDVLLPRTDEGRLFTYEVYRDDAAFDAHRNGRSVAQWREESAGMVVRMNVVRCASLE